MQKKIFINFSILSILIILTLSLLIVFVTYTDVLAQIRGDLSMQAKYFQISYEELGIDYLQNVGGILDRRVTLISSDGDVLYDNQADIDTLENHSDREEFIQAMDTGIGEGRRNSDTLHLLTYYYALKLENGEILRLAVTTKGLVGLYDQTYNLMIFIIIANIFFSMIISKKVTKNIIKPINQINLDDPLSNEVYSELSPLLTKMHRQKHKIDEQIEEIKMKNNEFKFITETMSEALIVFASDRHILSANKFSQVLFSCEAPKGKNYLSFCRNVDYIRILEQAFSGKSAETKYFFDNKYYLLSATPVLTKGDFAVVLFGSDITEKEQNEQIRRDFSANVSHELKTPLTSIIGFSDIMQNGIAKAEDFPHFIEKINDEAKRLLTLIEDIIRLSSLDEDSIKREFTQINLLSMVHSVVEKLEFKAEKKGVKFHIKGSDISLNGVEHSIYELIFNLCDNAISYNKDNGDVYVEFYQSNENLIFTVRDTGIGIPTGETDHIFERFYRVDKSHSKDTGGTGLGLSIVKHIAILHDAKIEISSQLNQGTKITLTF